MTTTKEIQVVTTTKEIPVVTTTKEIQVLTTNKEIPVTWQSCCGLGTLCLTSVLAYIVSSAYIVLVNTCDSMCLPSDNKLLLLSF